MKNILSLIVFLPIFLIFSQADTHDKLSARSSALDKVSSTSFVKRKTKNLLGSSDSSTTGQSTTEQPMTCSVSRYVRQTGYASDCICAIAFLYSPSCPVCAICRSCLVQPLDGKENPYGGNVDKNGQPIPPVLALPTMNSAYDAVFKAHVYSDDPICDNYVLPAGTELDPNYVPKPGFIFPTFLLGIQAGQGDVAMACNETLSKQAYKEAM